MPEFRGAFTQGFKRGGGAPNVAAQKAAAARAKATLDFQKEKFKFDQEKDKRNQLNADITQFFQVLTNARNVDAQRKEAETAAEIENLTKPPVRTGPNQTLSTATPDMTFQQFMSLKAQVGQPTAPTKQPKKTGPSFIQDIGPKIAPFQSQARIASGATTFEAPPTAVRPPPIRPTKLPEGLPPQVVNQIRSLTDAGDLEGLREFKKQSGLVIPLNILDGTDATTLGLLNDSGLLPEGGRLVFASDPLVRGEIRFGGANLGDVIDSKEFGDDPTFLTFPNGDTFAFTDILDDPRGGVFILGNRTPKVKPLVGTQIRQAPPEEIQKTLFQPAPESLQVPLDNGDIAVVNADTSIDTVNSTAGTIATTQGLPPNRDEAIVNTQIAQSDFAQTNANDPQDEEEILSNLEAFQKTLASGTVLTLKAQGKTLKVTGTKGELPLLSRDLVKKEVKTYDDLLTYLQNNSSSVNFDDSGRSAIKRLVIGEFNKRRLALMNGSEEVVLPDPLARKFALDNIAKELPFDISSLRENLVTKHLTKFEQSIPEHIQDELIRRGLRPLDIGFMTQLEKEALFRDADLRASKPLHTEIATVVDPITGLKKTIGLSVVKDPDNPGATKLQKTPAEPFVKFEVQLKQLPGASQVFIASLKKFSVSKSAFERLSRFKAMFPRLPNGEIDMNTLDQVSGFAGILTTTISKLNAAGNGILNIWRNRRDSILLDKSLTPDQQRVATTQNYNDSIATIKRKAETALRNFVGPNGERLDPTSLAFRLQTQAVVTTFAIAVTANEGVGGKSISNKDYNEFYDGLGLSRGAKGLVAGVNTLLETTEDTARTRMTDAFAIAPPGFKTPKMDSIWSMNFAFQDANGNVQSTLVRLNPKKSVSEAEFRQAETARQEQRKQKLEPQVKTLGNGELKDVLGGNR